MGKRLWIAALAAAVLCACAKHPTVPSGTQILDEEVRLTRVDNKQTDLAQRVLTVDDDVILAVFVDENLTDVKVNLTVDTGNGEPWAVEVENNLGGAGIELASVQVPEDAQVRVTLVADQDAAMPGKVHLRVRQYAASALRDPEFAAKLRAFKAWTIATNSRTRAASAKETGILEMQSAINGFDAPRGDAALSAEARLIRARMLQYFKIDPREARAEAQRAAAAFSKLPTPDVANVARANYIEALSLYEISGNAEATSPTPDEARQLSRGLLQSVGSTESPLGPIEKARALALQGRLDIDLMRVDDATKHFEQARETYREAGYVAGERDMRVSLPMVLVEEGRFAEAATAYDPLLPELDRIRDPELRAKAYIAVARSQSLSGRSDEAVPILMKALAYTREHQLQMQLATVLESLGYIYTNRGDMKQAEAFYDQALKIMSENKDGAEYAFALTAAADAARQDGDLDRALELSTEAVRVSGAPIAKARTPIELAVIYRVRGDLPRCISTVRQGLAVDLGDPRHHAHTDSRIVLAQCETEYAGSTPADLAEAGKMLAEALETSTQVHDTARQILTYRHLGHLNARLGKNEAALKSFDRALTLSQELRARSTSTEVRASMLRDEQGAFRGYLEIMLANVAKRPPGRLAAATSSELAALRRLETARRASFGALQVGALDAATSAHIDDLLQQMGQKSQRIATLINGKLDNAQATELQNLQFDMSRLHAELDNIRWSAAAKNDKGATSFAWRVLDSGTAQLSYVLAQDHVFVLVRDSASTRLTVLPATRDELETQLAELAKLDVRTASAEIEKQIEKASAALMPPGLLPKNSTAVQIVAEGRIANVPFSALRSPIDARRRLVDTHDIAMVTSLFGVDAAPRQKAARPFRFVALASGHGTYRDAGQADPTPKLQAATREIKLAAELFEAQDPAAKIKLLAGADGNAVALREIWASGADVVHFATHALADLRQPIASLLVLPATDEAGRSTYLTAGQVQGWRGDTELVFLSACESAVGPPQFAAGMPGLQRAFLRAGARGVIATLWPIEDVLAQEFSESFYRRFTGGESAARALSNTQREWLAPKEGASEAEQMRRRITALAHGLYTQ